MKLALQDQLEEEIIQMCSQAFPLSGSCIVSPVGESIYYVLK
jgi:hypothetical protein